MITFDQIIKSVSWCFTREENDRRDIKESRGFALGLLVVAVALKTFNLISKKSFLLTTGAGFALLASLKYPIPLLTTGPYFILIPQIAYGFLYVGIRHAAKLLNE